MHGLKAIGIKLGLGAFHDIAIALKVLSTA